MRENNMHPGSAPESQPAQPGTVEGVEAHGLAYQTIRDPQNSVTKGRPGSKRKKVAWTSNHHDQNCADYAVPISTTPSVVR